MSGGPTTAAKTLPVLGAGAEQIPAFRTARRLGHRTIGVDRDPAAAGAKEADVFVPISTREADDIMVFLGDVTINGVLAPYTEAPQAALQVLAAHYATAWRPASAATRASIDKGYFRRVLEGLPFPCYRSVQGRDLAQLLSSAAGLRLPLVVKPADNSGAKGISTLHDLAALPQAIERARSFAFEGGVVIEEYVEGDHLSAECFMRRGRLWFGALSDFGNSGPPHFLSRTHNVPAALDHAATDQVLDMIQTICRTVDYVDGPLTMDLIAGPNGEVYPVEMSARLGGNGMSPSLRAAFGVDVLAAAVQLALGEPFSLTPSRNRHAMTQVLSSSVGGRITAIRGVEEARQLPGVDTVDVFPAVGDQVVPYTSAADKLGLILVTGETRAEAAATMQLVLSLLAFDIQPEMADT